MIVLESPITARLVGYDAHEKRLAAMLSYVDGKVDQEISRHKKRQGWFAAQYGVNAYLNRLKQLQDSRVQTLLFRDDRGLFTRSGLAARIAEAFKDEIRIDFPVPEQELMRWSKAPKHEMRPYQVEGRDLLLKHRHAAIEHATGAGKSLTVLQLAKTLGLQTVIITPSASIANQLYREFADHLGTRFVGIHGDGKKSLGKRFTIAIGASLARVRPGSKEAKFYAKTQVVIGDEAHTLPAKTLENVCHGILANAPYRFFVSATQMRNDGLDLVLEGITGPVVHRLSVKDCVDQGYLARPKFTMLQVNSSDKYTSKTDPNDLTRHHLFYNDQVNRLAADLANRFVSLMQRPTIILIDEVEQFRHLQPHLKHDVKFAHGPLNDENRDKVPAEHQNVDVDQLVEDFNNGKIPILVGTSCISTGTDLRPTEAIIYLQGGKSEIQVKQAVGRGTRGGTSGSVKNPWTGKIKTDCHVIDFDVTSVGALHRHSKLRAEIYENIYGPVSYLDYRKY